MVEMDEYTNEVIGYGPCIKCRYEDELDSHGLCGNCNKPDPKTTEVLKGLFKSKEKQEV